MINPGLLEKVVQDQMSRFKERDLGIKRNIDFQKYLKTQQITVISGVRRSGKSTLLKQFSGYYDSFYYLNFDDERLVDFSIADFQTLMLTFQKLFPAKVVLLDEIQNVPQWERFVRRIFEEECKIFLTGSNARLLSSELATHLTGRYFKLELFPFSFREFLDFHAAKHGVSLSTSEEAEILKHFNDFAENGSFPEFIKNRDKEILTRIFEDIVYRDLISRFKIREVKNFKLLINYIFSNFTKEISYNSVKDFLDFKSATTVKNYVDFTRESYLAFELFKHDYSLKKQFVSNKKIYVIDNGMRNSVAFYFSGDRGRLLENIVFLELKRKGEEIFYFKEKGECDFVTIEKNRVKEALQVTERLEKNNEKRELGGLVAALKKFNLKSGLMLTENQEEERSVENFTIKIQPIWKWLLE